MKKISFLLAALCLLTIYACKNDKPAGAASEEAQKDSAQVDTTIYGVIALDDMGGGTFAITPEGTDTVLTLPRSDMEGNEAVIFGPVSEGDRWAVTVRHLGTPDQSLSRAINVTQVKKFTKAFKIVNGNLVLNDSDSVRILVLDDDSLYYQERDGHKDKFYKMME